MTSYTFFMKVVPLISFGSFCYLVGYLRGTNWGREDERNKFKKV
jgi:hypothetical protein